MTNENCIGPRREHVGEIDVQPVLAVSSSTIVFTFGGDPVREGYVASLNRPGGNVTGITWFNNLLRAKALGLLHELVPNAAVIAMMTNAKLPETARTLSDAEEAARTLGRQLLVLNASVPSEIDTVRFVDIHEDFSTASTRTGSPTALANRQLVCCDAQHSLW